MISFVLGWIFYATMAELMWMFFAIPLPTAPVAALEPFRIANRYGLFGIMTRGRYEIEFQGSEDGKFLGLYGPTIASDPDDTFVASKVLRLARE